MNRGQSINLDTMKRAMDLTIVFFIYRLIIRLVDLPFSNY